MKETNYSVTEAMITEKLIQALEKLPYVYAFWIEGSFALGTADEFSDVDYWVDVEDEKVPEMIEVVETALESLGEIDEKEIRSSEHPKLGQIVYHVKGASPFLVLDFNWQKHSRDRKEYHYIIGDTVEGAKVLFDRDEVVRFEPEDRGEILANRESCMSECKYYYSQHDRVEKYIQRNTYPESYAYYNKYVIEPLVKMLRLIYTPLYPYHYLLHISQHMPKEVIERLNNLIQVKTLEEMHEKMAIAEEWFDELELQLL